jgi:hypothetical protein
VLFVIVNCNHVKTTLFGQPAPPADKETQREEARAADDQNRNDNNHAHNHAHFRAFGPGVASDTFGATTSKPRVFRRKIVSRITMNTATSTSHAQPAMARILYMWVMRRRS